MIIRNKKGTALLTAMLVMGVLISVSLILSTLIIREIRITADDLNSGKAYYAAESGIEEALYNLETKLAGWSGEANDRQIFGASFDYKVKNTCGTFPCLDPEEYDLTAVPTYKFYGVLGLNDNITIPLFTVGEAGNIKSVKDFTVEFFAGFNPAADLEFTNAAAITGWDVLRWKVFGMKKVGDNFVTESIDDFTAISNQNSGGDLVYTNAGTPSWFGTKKCDSGSGIQCLEYAQSADAEGQLCTTTQARHFYIYQYKGDQKEVISVNPCYDISTFMSEHQTGVAGATGLNYLSLTNMVNPSVFKEKDDTKVAKMARIYYRVDAHGEDLVREAANITSDGYSGNSKQSINVQIKKDSYMPVFNFSVYSTYKK